MNNTVLIVIAVIAVLLLIFYGLNQTISFLLWAGLILLIVAVVLFLVRMMSGRRGV